ncbi:hypothetical protein B0H17DRAFT_426680 [Mycena rosella]|uniref:FAD-binding domain-containing protein n=1 Tax=Mycena rosella TaxID=1033263 RepID=A0AAD7GKX7_MYCRO|nr:hypothetical protein B0H17DRAFT_426680 [Mycena rosella]
MTDSEAALKFIIVGASIAGLASAIALKHSGHNVVVLERESKLGGTILGQGGCARVPPNGCKILFDWGLEAQTRANTSIAVGFGVYKHDGGMAPNRDFVGTSRFNPELMSEARGDFVQFRYHDLLRILYEEATKISERVPVSRVTVLFGADVANVDSDSCSVTLLSGEIHTGDAIIGADGPSGVVRRTLLQEEDVNPEICDVRTGMALCSAVIPKALAIQHPDLASFYEYPASTVSMGSNSGSITCAVGTENDISLWVYTPDSSQDGTWTQEADKKLPDVLGPCDAKIRKLAALAGSANCVQSQDHHELESWVSASGKVLVLGEAAHPFPPASLHAYSVCLEDGAFIGKIFSYARNPERIPEFFYAFEEHRRSRCSRIREAEKQYIGVITLPDGELQVRRDVSMRANHAAGRDVMEGEESNLQQMLDDMRMVFAYDPADDADEWWMSWGRFRDSANIVS